MSKISLSKPILICLYGFPGAGKSFFARNITNHLQIAHLDAERIRHELFRKPRYDAQENSIINHLMNYLTETMLNAGLSVVYDTNVRKVGQRRKLHELARRHKADYLMIWLQIDPESAFARTQRRDRRTYDDRYAPAHTRESFQQSISSMQNPKDEPYMVVSGKHAFVTQKSALLNRLYQIGLIPTGTVTANVAKPELVNLIPNPITRQVDFTRRNITIR